MKRSLFATAVVLALVAVVAWLVLASHTSQSARGASTPADGAEPSVHLAPDIEKRGVTEQSGRPEAVRVTSAAPRALPPSVPHHPVETAPRLEPPAPAAAEPPTSADGGTRYALDRDGIRTAVRAAIPELRYCYEEWLKLEPEIGGKLQVTFIIDTGDGVEGRVTQLSLGDGGIGNVALEGCILSVFQDLLFEAPGDGPLRVVYPIILSARPDGG